MFSRLLTKTPATPGPASRTAQLATAVMDQMAVIWFKPDGTIEEANHNFCKLMGYDAAELPGQHHSIFCGKHFVHGPEYEAMWEKLRAGQSIEDTVSIYTKSENRIFIRGTYYPVKDAKGTVTSVVKFASDVTDSENTAIEATEKLAAIDRTQAVIEFQPDGTIIKANQNFLDTTGYSLEEIQGKSHRMFLTPDDADDAAYSSFWTGLANGTFQQGNFVRLNKRGQRICLSATYSPIRDSSGHVYKVIKFAIDRTDQMRTANDLKRQIEALGKSNAMIEFDVDGTVLNANELFLTTMGYRLDEIVGQKHAMFVEPQDRNSPQYKKFWADLSNGTYQSGEFPRRTKSGEQIWIAGSYNPIIGLDGKPYKVVKFARDISPRKFAVTRLVEGLQALSDGDLTAKINETLTDEFDQLRIDFNGSMTQLCSVMSQVLEASGDVKLEVDAISTSAGELSKRTERQAANLEETAAAMEQLAASVKSAAGAAQEAQSRVVESNALAQTGGEIVATTVAAMDDISNSSEKVSKIITVIDEIAFQTNLLALNAGVEAARAGESGRGFAVVASEVRALAQRSSVAAREIADLISLSSRQVKKGVELVGETGASLTRICESVTAVLSQVEVIARLSDEQSLAITEINTAVGDIDNATQQNAAMFEEITAATQTMTQTTNTLIGSTRAFKIDAISSPQPSQQTESPQAQVAPPTPKTTPSAPALKGSVAMKAVSQKQAEPMDEGWEDF